MEKLTNFYKNKKILITGVTGFKGSWLCFWLKNLDAKVVGVGLKPEKGSILFKSLELKKIIKQYFLDISNLSSSSKQNIHSSIESESDI